MQTIHTQRKRRASLYRALLTTLMLAVAASLTLIECRHPRSPAGSLAPIPRPKSAADLIVNGAKAEARRGVSYDSRYREIEYPWGDVAPDRGACTDVVIRALRHAGYDLQGLIHEDMAHHFSRYPHRYGAGGPDANIDHRRAPNQIAFLRRRGLELPIETTGPAVATWQPGDIVYWTLPGGSGHCGVLSNARNGRGLPLVIHNMHRAQQEDCLTAWKIIGHFRYPAGVRQGSPRRHGGTERARSDCGEE